MAKHIRWTEQAQAELRAIQQDMAMRILLALTRFVNLGTGDVKQLQGAEPPEFRLRVGDYRVRFRSDADSIIVVAVGHRRDVYR